MAARRLEPWSSPGREQSLEFEGKSFSDFARDAIFEKIEDTYDLQELRGAVVADTGERHSQAQVLAELGL